MKKSLVALALFGAFASVAQAQSSVVIYGALDAGYQHLGRVANGVERNTIGAIGDNNKLGFKGVEDLGNGLKALFQLEMRFAPDTGTVEGVSATNPTGRPLFQGESRVGLQGAFGTVRIGRGKTAFQDSSAAFEPWSGAGNTTAGFQADMTVGNFNSDPLNTTAADTYGKNRISNAVFYNSPVFSGFQANVSVGTKEGGTGVITATTPTVTAVPYSASATYNMGIVGALVAYERNATQDKVWSVAASVAPIADLKLMASYAKSTDVDAGTPSVFGVERDTKAWVLGANYTMGAGKFLAGYGQMKAETSATTEAKTKRASLGYQYSLSKRTYVYADLSNKHVSTAAAGLTSVNGYGVGLHHNF